LPEKLALIPNHHPPESAPPAVAPLGPGLKLVPALTERAYTPPMATLVFPLLVAVVGALVYAFASSKVSELGRISFFVGLLWLVYVAATKSVHF
jgi:hypothetical protein